MAAPLPVLTAVPGPDEARLVSSLGRAPEVAVVRRCADLGELLSASAAGHGRAALVAPDLHRLDRDALARLADAGVAVVGVLPAVAPEAAASRLVALGVHRHVPADAPGQQVAAVVLAAVDDVVRAAVGTAAGAAGGVPVQGRRRLDDVVLGAPAPDGVGEDPGDGEDGAAGDAVGGRRDAGGRLVAVWGAPGAPGRTTVAAGLAAELAAAGETVLLVDADTWAASLAQVLGLLDESAGVAAACRAAAAGVLTPGRLADLAPEAAPRLRVLTGLPRAERWHELGTAALEEVWATCRRTAAWTVVDCAAPLEQDEELLLEVAAPRRNAATTTALAAADVVLAVGTGRPGGAAAARAGPGRARGGAARGCGPSAGGGDQGAVRGGRPRPGGARRGGAGALRRRPGRRAGAGRPGRVRRRPPRRQDAGRGRPRLAGPRRADRARRAAAPRRRRRPRAAAAPAVGQDARMSPAGRPVGGGVRVYAALAPHQLAEVLSAGHLPDGAPVHAVTAALREQVTDGDEEELELAALLDAADSSLRLIAGTAGTSGTSGTSSTDGGPGPARRLVLAGDVPGASVRQRPVGDGDPAEAVTRVEPTAPLGLRAVVSAHVDEAEAEPDVAAAAAALRGADAGDEAAGSVVESARDRDLLWYDASELAALAAELGSRGSGGGGGLSR